MRLDPAGVRYVLPLLQVRTRGGGVRFAGRHANVQLTETALVCEGDLYKAGFFGTEGLLGGAVAERSAVTVPYSRIDRAGFVRWSRPQLLLMALGLLSCLTISLGLLGLFLLWRARGLYRVRFRGPDGRPRVVLFRIWPKATRVAFDGKLAAYRAAAGGAG